MVKDVKKSSQIHQQGLISTISLKSNLNGKDILSISRYPNETQCSLRSMASSHAIGEKVREKILGGK